MTTCTYHCSPCGRHFHSLAAFDVHHERNDDGWPCCAAPLDLVDKHGQERLVALTDAGECRVYSDVEHGVMIWTGAGYKQYADRVSSSAVAA
jgi:hypothetical protein